MILDLIEMPGFNLDTQRDRGDWSLRDVSAGTVTQQPTDKVRCVDHGAMNCVNPERTIWRCLMCGRAAYRPTSNLPFEQAWDARVEAGWQRNGKPPASTHRGGYPGRSIIRSRSTS